MNWKMKFAEPLKVSISAELYVTKILIVMNKYTC